MKEKWVLELSVEAEKFVEDCIEKLTANKYTLKMP